jgi:hypothetical protein
MITDDERKSFGWLGRIPPEIVDASRDIVEKWKLLASDAKQVAKMQQSQKKIERAKAIERRYYDLLEYARHAKRQDTEGRSDGT